MARDGPARLIDRGGPAFVAVHRYDTAAPEAIAAIAPWQVIDAWPFQNCDRAIPHAATAAGAHYIDLVDGRNPWSASRRPSDVAARRAGAHGDRGHLET